MKTRVPYIARIDSLEGLTFYPLSLHESITPRAIGNQVGFALERVGVSITVHSTVKVEAHGQQ